MGNDRLRSALAQAGLEIEDLAAQAGVDAKTVGRWLAGRPPRPRYRIKVAGLLGRDEHDLWPDLAPTIRQTDATREITAAYTTADDIHLPDWRVLLDHATEQIDLLGTTLTDIITAHGLTDLLATKADRGCRIRILIAHPESITITTLAQQLDQDQRDDQGWTPIDYELDRVRAQLEPLTSHPTIELRAHWAERQNTILRFDDDMLLTLHTWGTLRAQSPILHLHRRTPDGLFEAFAAHLHGIYQHASEPIRANADLYPMEP